MDERALFISGEFPRGGDHPIPPIERYLTDKVEGYNTIESLHLPSPLMRREGGEVLTQIAPTYGELKSSAPCLEGTGYISDSRYDSIAKGNPTGLAPCGDHRAVGVEEMNLGKLREQFF
jgi:hypothetical protein